MEVKIGGFLCTRVSLLVNLITSPISVGKKQIADKTTKGNQKKNTSVYPYKYEYIYISTRRPMQTEIRPPKQDLRKSGLKLVHGYHFPCLKGNSCTSPGLDPDSSTYGFGPQNSPNAFFSTANTHGVESLRNTCAGTPDAKHWNDV